MRILITNDDGIHAEGLQVLERIASTLSDEVWVVAPETDQSGFAHSLSLSEPLRLREIGERRFAVRGTPTDCVIMGAKQVMPAMPDLILSGVNSGSNIADDVTYSGTIAAAMEGTLLGVRAIALSQSFRQDEDGKRIVPWSTAEELGPSLVDRLIGVDLPAGVFLNVNFPACRPKEVKGRRVTAQGKVAHGMWIDQRTDGRGVPYYWLRFKRETLDLVEGTDIHAVRNDFVSVTPLHLDLTAHEIRGRVAEALG
ncbi:MAG: 5'/3'-nucleotidase SurE [Thauera sp.]